MHAFELVNPETGQTTPLPAAASADTLLRYQRRGYTLVRDLLNDNVYTVEDHIDTVQQAAALADGVTYDGKEL